jgi:hypothetical protein
METEGSLACSEEPATGRFFYGNADRRLGTFLSHFKLLGFYVYVYIQCFLVQVNYLQTKYRPINFN